MRFNRERIENRDVSNLLHSSSRPFIAADGSSCFSDGGMYFVLHRSYHVFWLVLQTSFSFTYTNDKNQGKQFEHPGFPFILRFNFPPSMAEEKWQKKIIITTESRSRTKNLFSIFFERKKWKNIIMTQCISSGDSFISYYLQWCIWTFTEVLFPDGLHAIFRSDRWHHYILCGNGIGQEWQMANGMSILSHVSYLLHTMQ